VVEKENLKALLHIFIAKIDGAVLNQGPNQFSYIVRTDLLTLRLDVADFWNLECNRLFTVCDF